MDFIYREITSSKTFPENCCSMEVSIIHNILRMSLQKEEDMFSAAMDNGGINCGHQIQNSFPFITVARASIRARIQHLILLLGLGLYYG